MRALLVHGSNVVVSAPERADGARRTRRLELLVVCDFFLSETAALADVVLRSTQWAEEEGTMTSLEGRVHPPPPGARSAPAGVRSELWILHELARVSTLPADFELDPPSVFDELRRHPRAASPTTRDSSHALLDTGVAAHWPYPVGIGGTPRLFRERFAHADGLARIVAGPPRDRREPPQTGEAN